MWWLACYSASGFALSAGEPADGPIVYSDGDLHVVSPTEESTDPLVLHAGCLHGLLLPSTSRWLVQADGPPERVQQLLEERLFAYLTPIPVSAVDRQRLNLPLQARSEAAGSLARAMHTRRRNCDQLAFGSDYKFTVTQLRDDQPTGFIDPRLAGAELKVR